MRGSRLALALVVALVVVAVDVVAVVGWVWVMAAVVAAFGSICCTSLLSFFSYSLWVSSRIRTCATCCICCCVCSEQHVYSLGFMIGVLVVQQLWSSCAAVVDSSCAVFV